MKKRTLADMVDYIQPTNYIVSSDQYSDDYSTPVLTAGQTFLLGYTDDKQGIFEASSDNPVILFDDFTTASQWVNFSFKVKSSACKILVPKDSVNLKYIFYAMKHINFDNTQHKRYWISEYSKQKINCYENGDETRIVTELDRISELLEISKRKINLLNDLVKSRFIGQEVAA